MVKSVRAELKMPSQSNQSLLIDFTQPDQIPPTRSLVVKMYSGVAAPSMAVVTLKIRKQDEGCLQ